MSLELEDFKSYGGRHAIGPFEDALTAVVGPNGAGKSNLMDALCFVLGVQSAALRASSLAELVHRPVSGPRPAHATVTATYARADGTSVRLSRRALLSGSAEHRVDGRTVTAAEYARVWENEGVLARARNSLVFQGDVEALATRSPRDLARVLETVSGSDELRAPYDEAKAELDAALEEAAGNAARKRGVGAELRAVAEQRADAQRYSTIVDEASELRTKVFLARLWGVESSAAAIDASLPALSDAVSAAERALQQVDTKSKGGNGSAVQRRLLAAERDDRAATEKLDEALPRLVTAEEEAQRTARRHAAAEAEADVLSRDAAGAQEDATRASAAADQSDAALAAFESGLPEVESADDASLAEYRRLRSEADAATARLSLEASVVAHRLAPTRAALSLLDAKEEEAQRAIVRAAREASAAEEAHRTALEQVVTLRTQKEEADGRVLAAEAEKRREEETAAEVTARLRAVASELLAAGAAAADGERETRVRVAVSALRRAFPGAVHGRLAEVVRPISRKYDAAAAVALGASMDAVVVADERTAVAALSLLREQRHPRLTLLPLDVLRNSGSGNSSGSLPDGARWAREVLRYEEGVSPAVEWAVGRVAVCDTLSIARSTVRQCARAVSLDGGVVHRSGLMSGGAYDAAGRWDAEAVEGLRAERDALLEALRSSALRLRGADGEGAARALAAEASSLLDAALRRVDVLRRRAESSASVAEAAAAEARRVATQRSDLISRMRGDEEEAARISAAVAKAEARVFAAFCAAHSVRSLAEWEMHVSGASSAAALGAQRTLLEQRSALQAAATRARHAREYAAERVADLQRRLSEARTHLLAVAEAAQAAEARLGAIRDEVALLRAARTKTAALLESAQRLAEEARAEAERSALERRRLHDALAEASRTHVAAAVDGDRLRLERDRILRAAQLEGVSIGRTRSGSIDFSALGRAERAVDALPGMEARLASLAAEAERLSPTLRATDAIDGAEGRLRDALGACERERERLRAAKEAFSVVRSERQRRFAGALSHVASRVDAIYKALTAGPGGSGGSAFVAAENTEEPYLEGVRFHAMPPAKRFLDMEQLSGGERTVAALALLFALQTYRPAPFFVLDEVDAALDGANVHRLASFLRQWASGSAVISGCGGGALGGGHRVSDAYTQSQASQPALPVVLPPTQFVVISLKAALYEHADALVGVVRDPPTRISRVLTLRLADAE